MIKKKKFATKNKVIFEVESKNLKFQRLFYITLACYYSILKQGFYFI